MMMRRDTRETCTYGITIVILYLSINGILGQLLVYTHMSTERAVLT